MYFYHHITILLPRLHIVKLMLPCLYVVVITSVVLCAMSCYYSCVVAKLYVSGLVHYDFLLTPHFFIWLLALPTACMLLLTPPQNGEGHALAQMWHVLLVVLECAGREGIERQGNNHEFQKT